MLPLKNTGVNVISTGTLSNIPKTVMNMSFNKMFWIRTVTTPRRPQTLARTLNNLKQNRNSLKTTDFHSLLQNIRSLHYSG